MDDKIDYRNKVILAPMVRTGTLPFRLLALHYGADIVYSEELIDRKVVQCDRIVNEQANSVEYVKDGNVVWSTCPQDTPTVIQLGTASAEWAVKAAHHFHPEDYDAIDVNMGCPLPFSVQGGMGSALLRDRERVKQVISALVRNVNKQITCKIRIFPDIRETIDLVKTIEMEGASAVAVHGRLIPERDKHKAHWDAIKAVQDAMPHFPIIANGDVLKHEDIARIKEETGCSSVMIARGALWNCSVFSPIQEPNTVVAQKYVENCMKYSCPFSYAKYTVLKMFEVDQTKAEIFRALTKAKSLEAFHEIIRKENAQLASAVDDKPQE